MNIIRGNNILTVRASPDMVDGLRTGMRNVISLPVFSNRNVHASFIANFMDDFVLFAILIILEVMMVLLKLCASRFKAESLVTCIQTLQILTRYNLPLMLLAINIGDIFFFSIVFLRSSNLDSPLDGADLYLCVLMLIICATFLIMTACLVHGAKKAKREDKESKSSKNFDTFKQEWMSFQVLFGGCDTSSRLSESFYLIYIIRLTIPMILAGTLESAPLAQTIIYLNINVAMLTYILVHNPIKSKINRLNVILLELIMLAINICAAILASFDAKTEQDRVSQNSINTVSNAIIIFSYFIDVLAILFLITKIVLVFVKALKLRKEASKHERAAWLQLLLIPLQQGCLCVEEVQIDFVAPQHAKAVSFKTETLVHLQTVSDMSETQRTPTLQRPISPPMTLPIIMETRKSTEIIDIEEQAQEAPVELPAVMPAEPNTILIATEVFNESPSPSQRDTPLVTQEAEPFIMPNRLSRKKRTTVVPEPPNDLLEVFKRTETRSKFALDELAIIDDSPYARKLTFKSSIIMNK